MVIVECEVFSRVTGYIRPVNDWNLAKQEEFKDRVMFDSFDGLWESTGGQTSANITTNKKQHPFS